MDLNNQWPQRKDLTNQFLFEEVNHRSTHTTNSKESEQKLLSDLGFEWITSTNLEKFLQKEKRKEREEKERENKGSKQFGVALGLSLFVSDSASEIPSKETQKLIKNKKKRKKEKCSPTGN